MIPERLKQGDCIGIAALASPPCMAALASGIELLESLGLHVKLGKHISEIEGYLAGTDAERLADFHELMADHEVKAIFFACGGYGSGRIAPLIDYQLIASNPKILWGYSDMTYLLTSIRQSTGLVGFHGPMIASDLGKSRNPLDMLSKFNQLFTPKRLVLDKRNQPLEVLSQGEATGELVGGNLSILVSTLGTPFEIMTDRRILFIEDVNEAPYKVDSMLQQLTYAGKLAEAAGVVIGDFSKAEPTGSRPSFTLEEVLNEYLTNLSIPVIKGFRIGHCDPQEPVPFGVRATLSTSSGALIIEPGVC